MTVLQMLGVSVEFLAVVGTPRLNGETWDLYARFSLCRHPRRSNFGRTGPGYKKSAYRNSCSFIITLAVHPLVYDASAEDTKG